MADIDKEKDDFIEEDDDVTPAQKKAGNVFFYVAISILCVIAVIVIFYGLSSKKQKAAEAEGELEAAVAEEYSPANKTLVLPKERVKDNKPKPLMLEEEKTATARPTGLLRRPADPSAAPPLPEGAPPLPQAEAQLSKEDLKEQKRLKKEWEDRRQASPVIYNKTTDKEEQRRSERQQVDVNKLSDDIMRNVERNSAAAGGGMNGRAKPGKDDIEGRMVSAKTVTTYATRMQDTPYKLTQGAMLGCVLETAINSELPGYTRCLLSEDSYSYDGSILLLQKGSRVIGQYQGGIQQGESRIFVMWTRILTPDGLDIDLDSPGTSPLGATGHDMYVDSHFLERFGASALLSVVGGLAASESEGDVRMEAAADSFNKSAEIALQNSIKIRPTGHKNQGDKIRIFVAKDIDFSPVLKY
jgi:type IV secretion system protein VirB10